MWKATWIPVVALGPSGDSYLEEMADRLESPALAARDRPGLIGGTLVWLSSIDPVQEDRWQSLTD